MVATDGDFGGGNRGLKILDLFIAMWVPFESDMGGGGINIVSLSIYCSLPGLEKSPIFDVEIPRNSWEVYFQLESPEIITCFSDSKWRVFLTCIDNFDSVFWLEN